MAKIIKDDRGTLYGAEFDFAGICTLASPTSIPVDSGLCVDIVNCDLDDENVASRRLGQTEVSTDVATSFNGQYCVSGGYLCTFDGATVTPLTTGFTVDPACEFKKVNTVTVFSDNTKIGIINGATVTRTDTPGDWVGVEDLEIWVTDHYPADPANWDGVTSNSNFEIDAFKLATLAGKCLEFYAGALYLAVDNFIYRTKTFDTAHMDIRYNVVAGFPDAVTMIAKVDDGLFVGTTTALYFLQGVGVWIDEKGNKQGSFKQTLISSHGVYYRSNVRIDSKQIQAVKTTGEIPMFASTLGVMVGTHGGGLVNLSDNKIDLPYSGQTCTAIFRPNQYICSFSGGYTVAVNTNTGTHSRFTNFTFESLFLYAGTYYGAKATGIYSLTGETDDSAKIDAFILTPAPHFDSRKLKTAIFVYLQGRCSGNMQVIIYCDEGDPSEDIPIYFDGKIGMHRKRGKCPKGLKGTNLQFKISNIDGTAFDISGLGVDILELNRTK